MTEIYSHSRLSTFEQCPLKYKFRYIDKIKPEIEKTIESHLGSSVHDTLEWIYNSVKEGKIIEINKIIEYYTESWEKEYNENILVVKNSIEEYFNKGVEYLTNYFIKYFPFKDGTIECEKKITIELDENTKIQGFIDRLVHNIESGTYEIHDYKTANTLPTQEKINEDRQLALYSIAIKEIYGKDKEVVLIWHYLAHNQKIISKRTDFQLEKLKKETIELVKKIKSTKEFPPKVSTLCHWCEYKKICPAWNKTISKENQMQMEKQKINEELNKFPTIKKYILKKEENPADKPDRENLNIF